VRDGDCPFGRACAQGLLLLCLSLLCSAAARSHLAAALRWRCLTCAAVALPTAHHERRREAAGGGAEWRRGGGACGAGQRRGQRVQRCNGARRVQTTTQRALRRPARALTRQAPRAVRRMEWRRCHGLRGGATWAWCSCWLSVARTRRQETRCAAPRPQPRLAARVISVLPPATVAAWGRLLFRTHSSLRLRQPELSLCVSAQHTRAPACRARPPLDSITLSLLHIDAPRPRVSAACVSPARPRCCWMRA
jgi:hypothetical protein